MNMIVSEMEPTPDDFKARVPEQVQAAADAADKALAAMAAAEKGDKLPAPNVDPNAVPQEPGLKKPEDASAGDTIESLTHKLSVLQGKYDAEIKALGEDPQLLNTLKAENRRLSRQNNEYSRIVSDQQDQLARVKAPPAPAASGTGKTGDGIESSLTEEELEYLAAQGIEGETLDIFNKLIDSRADAITQTRYGEVSSKVDSVVQTQAVSRNERFFIDLSKAVPNWRTINGSETAPNEAWLSWLDLRAPYQNRSRAEVLHEAQAGFDVETCVDIFNDFIRENPTSAAGSPHTPLPKPNPADLLEPDAASSTGAPPPGEPAFTMAEYERHHAEFTKGHWKGREDEWQRKTAIFDKAYKEGRIH